MKKHIKNLIKKIRLIPTKRGNIVYKNIENLDDLILANLSRNERHLFCHKYFWNYAPNWLKKHREYFANNQRSYGEDALHVMWYFLFQKFKPSKVLEIGVYRGSSLSLFSLLSTKLDYNCAVHGISPFSTDGDTVSEYLAGLNYYEDVLANFEYFNLDKPHLHKGFSTDPEMHRVIKSEVWDLIFIDGNHDFDVVKQDFDMCSVNVKKGGLIILDDSALYTDYKAPFYSFAGHPGPSRVADSIDNTIFEEIFSVSHNRVFQKL